MKDLKKGKWTPQALRVLQERYLHTKHPDGIPETPDAMIFRVASDIAQAEREYGGKNDDVREVIEKFYDIMIEHKFLPNSPTLMNAGLDNGLQYSACYVLPVDDSIESIFRAIGEAADVHKSGGGTGFNFSRIRPKGSCVSTTSGIASGPVSFMRVFDAATEAIKQGGKRRGANMGILRVDHPDIEEFITCKIDGGITNFNISVAITDAFMDALESGDNYDIVFNDKVVGQKNSEEVFKKIVDAAWGTGDPGLVFIDKINNSMSNPIPAMKRIEATNPCAESALFPYEACNLGSINLAKFITSEYGIDWDALKETVQIAVRFLDNVITVNPYPLEEITKEAHNLRRIGLGVMGWADMLFDMGIKYDTCAALFLAEKVMNFIKSVGIETSEELSKERGTFPYWQISIFNDIRPMRNCNITCIAPTGTISIIAGCSSGIEPLFALGFQHITNDRTLTFINDKVKNTLIKDGYWSKEVEQYILENGVLPLGLQAEYPHFVTSHQIAPEWHIKMQAAFQVYTHNAVSKTINLPYDATRKDIEDAYQLAYQLDCKGITVFRDGCKGTQVLNVGILKSKDATHYQQQPKSRPGGLQGYTVKKRTPVGTAYITVNSDNNGEPFEVFVNVGKAGSDVAADAEGLGRLISLVLRLPSSLSTQDKVLDIVGQLRGIGSGRAQGFGKFRIMSLADAIAQVLSEHVGLDVTNNDIPGLPDGDASKIGDLCPDCGQATFVFEEGCKKCHGCGYSEC